MRRSKAPSVLNKSKRFCITNSTENESNCSELEDKKYSWGSQNNNNVKYKRNISIFNVVWRDISGKKHKTWKGDGTLEVDNVSLKAILKDEVGKYMSSSKKINRHELVPDFQMIVGSKEIEIQNEIKSEEELYELRKRQIDYLKCGEMECITNKDNITKEKMPRGGFQFKPTLVLNSPKVTSDVKDETPTSNLEIRSETALCPQNFPVKHQIFNAELCKEFICFVMPSDLQQFLFQMAVEYISSVKSGSSIDKCESLDIVHVLKLICHHPSLIYHKTTTNNLIRHLLPALPDWAEMGPFDSGKLEFVQYFLADLSKLNPQTCIIFAKNANVLNMLQGLCDFMKIQCLRINKINSGEINQQVNDFFSSANNLTQVLLLTSVEMLSSFNIVSYCKKVIFFEEVSINGDICELKNSKDTIIYNLVTAFSIEELLLLDTYNNDILERLLDEIVNVMNTETIGCYLHSKIECNCFKNTDELINSSNVYLKNWKHFKSPFNEELLKTSLLENSSQNIVCIFCKKKN